MTSLLRKLALISILSYGLIGCSKDAGHVEPPNVILIVADDLGWADVGFHGSIDIETPKIDRIAQEGVVFTNAYVTHPLCSPSRAGILTGMHQEQFGYAANPAIYPIDSNAGLPLDQQTLAELLTDYDYECSAIGKWHLGMAPRFHPNQRGFKDFYGFLEGGHYYRTRNLVEDTSGLILDSWDKWYATPLQENGKAVQDTGYLTDLFSDKAVRYLNNCGESPFFLFLSYNAPHSPYQALEKDRDRFNHIKDSNRRRYAAMVYAMDRGIGAILNTLDSLDRAENTMVVFMSDHGGPTKSHPASNAPFTGGKGELYEGGIRVPMAVRWPSMWQGNQRFESPVSSTDIFATVSDVLNSPTSSSLYGKSLVTQLEATDTLRHRELFWRALKVEQYALRRENFKLLRDEDRSYLFDLTVDTAEQKDLSKTLPDTLDAMNAALERWIKTLKSPDYERLGG